MTETVLEEAQRIVYGTRPDEYGHPLDNHGCTSEMMAAYLFRKYGVRVPLVAEDTAVWNVLQKISREANAPKRDNRTDGAGYFGNVQMIHDERDRRSGDGEVKVLRSHDYERTERPWTEEHVCPTPYHKI